MGEAGRGRVEVGGAGRMWGRQEGAGRGREEVVVVVGGGTGRSCMAMRVDIGNMR